MNRKVLLALYDNEQRIDIDYTDLTKQVVDGVVRFTGPQERHSSHFVLYSQFASLWGGTTLPQYRGKGLYTAVLATRVQEAIRRGYSFLTIDASKMSRPIAEKYGFQLLTYAHACMWYPE